KALPLLVRTRPTLFSMALLGLVVLFALPSSLPMATRLLIAWCVATFLFIIAVAWKMTGRSSAELERNATDLDSNAIAILILSGLAAAASFVAVAFELVGMQAVPQQVRGLHLALALSTVVCSWFFVQTMFAIHYTH